MLSTGAWNAMLKLLEEPPKTTIFLLCTTDPQKIPGTILSRVQRYDFQRISFEGIVERLNYIIVQECEEIIKSTPENITEDDLQSKLISVEQQAIEYIAKIADGGMRDAISLLDKCISFNNNLSIENVVNALGISDYDSLDKLLYKMITKDKKECLNIIELLYRDGKDLKQFIKQEIQFILDICKYLIYGDFKYCQIPNTIDLSHFTTYGYDAYLNILDDIITLSNDIKYETNPKITIQSKILLICK